MTNYEIIRELLPTLSADEQAKIKAALDAQPGLSFADLIGSEPIRVSSALIAVASSSLRMVRGKVYSVTSVRTAIPLLMTFPTHF